MADNPYMQYTVQAPAPEQGVAAAPQPSTGENPYMKYAIQAPEPVSATTQPTPPSVDDRPIWAKAMSSMGDAMNAPFAGATTAVGNTVMGAAQLAAEGANKLGIKNDIGDKIAAMKADDDKDEADYLQDKPVTKALDTGGKMAGDAGTFSALGGAGDVGYIKNAVIGAGQGALQVAQNGADRIKNSAFGAGAATAGKAAFDLGSKALGYTADALSPAAQKAKELIQKVFATDGIEPEALASAMEKGSETGLPLTAIDHAQDVSKRGARNALGMLDTAVNTPGDAAAQAQALKDRVDTRGQRLRDMFDALVSNTTKREVNDSVFKQMQDEAGPAYEAANAVKPVYNDTIKEGLKNPDVVAGIPLGIKIQQNEAYGQNKPFEPYDKDVMDYVTKVINGERGTEAIPGVKNKFTGEYDKPPVEATSGTPDTLVHEVTPLETPNMRLLDAAKKGLDAKIAAETDPLTGKVSPYGRSLAQAKTRFLAGVDEANPLYAEARLKYGTAASRESAFNRGRDFTNADPEDIQDFIHGNALKDIEPASEADQNAYYAGARRNVEDLADKMNDSSNFGQRLWKQGYQKRVQSMLPQDGESFDKMDTLMNHEQNMANTDSVLGNSKTFQRGQYRQALDDAGSSKLAQTAAKAIKFITHPLRATANAGSDMMQNSLKEGASKKTGDISAEVSKYLLSKDPAMIRSLGQSTSSPAWLNAVPAAAEGAEEATVPQMPLKGRR